MGSTELATESGSAQSAGTWRLGDVTVNRLGFGAMRLASAAAFVGDASRDRGESIAVLRRARELGVDHFDTAAFYFSNRLSANELLNSAFPDHDDDIVIATKVGPARTPSGDWADPASPSELRGQVEENLRQLGRDRLDIVYLRVFGAGSIAEHFGALSDLQRDGLIGSLGISNVSVAQLTEALTIAPVVSVQNRFGLDDHPAEALAVLAETTRLGIAFVPYFAMAGTGRERGRKTEERRAVLQIAEAHGASSAQVRLAWTLHQGPNVLAIPGTGDLRHLEQNVEAGALRFTEDELRLLAAS